MLWQRRLHGGRSSGSFANTDTSLLLASAQATATASIRATDLILEQARVLYARWPEELVLGN